MKTAAIIVAAGRGARAGGGMPKQWRPLAGKRVADWSVAAFSDHPDISRVVLVVHPGDMSHAGDFAGVTLVPGGETRAASVRAGLDALAPQPPDAVLVHDVARPLVTRALISRVVDTLAHSPGAAPALPVTDALWRVADHHVTETVSREGLWRAQTPQGFRFSAFLAAHRAHAADAADDVEVARAAGLAVAVVPGEERNIKITGPEDFDRAEALMRG